MGVAATLCAAVDAAGVVHHEAQGLARDRGCGVGFGYVGDGPRSARRLHEAWQAARELVADLVGSATGGASRLQDLGHARVREPELGEPRASSEKEAGDRYGGDSGLGIGYECQRRPPSGGLLLTLESEPETEGAATLCSGIAGAAVP